MPPLPSVPNVVKAQLLWNDSVDLDISTTLYFSYSGGSPGNTDANNLAVVLANNMATNLTLWPPSVQLVGARVTDLSSSSGAQGIAGADIVGTAPGAILGGSTSVLANYQIRRRYRGGKPRSYFPFGTSSDLTTRQAWAPAFTEGVETGLLSFFSGFVGTTEGPTTITGHVNVSYYEGFTTPVVAPGKRAKNVSTPRAVPLVDQVTGLSVSSTPASQRRRNRG